MLLVNLLLYVFMIIVRVLFFGLCKLLLFIILMYIEVVLFLFGFLLLVVLIFIFYFGVIFWLNGLNVNMDVDVVVGLVSLKWLCRFVLIIINVNGVLLFVLFGLYVFILVIGCFVEGFMFVLIVFL